MADRPSFVTSQQLAQFFGLTPERIRQLTKDGMPSEGRGRYDFVTATRWYIQFLQEAVKRRTTEGGVGGADALRKERAASIGIDTELKRIDLMRARGELIPVTEAVRMFEGAVAQFKAKMLAGVSRAGIRLMGARTQARATAVVEEVVIEALSEMKKIGGEWIETANGHHNGRAR